MSIFQNISKLWMNRFINICCIDEVIFRSSYFLCLKAFLYGVLSGTFSAPLYFWPGLIIGLRFLSKEIFSYDLSENDLSKDNLLNNKKKNSMLIGFLFWFGYWCCLLYWIYQPLYIAGLREYWPLLLGVLGVPAFLAMQFVFSQFSANILLKLSNKLKIKINQQFMRYFFCVMIWGMLEYFRMLFYPFYPISFLLLSSLMTSQLFAYFDVCVLNIVILSIFLLPNNFSKRSVYINHLWFYCVCAGVISTLFSSLLDFDIKFSKVRLALIQPNIDQSLKNTYLGAKQAEYVIQGLSYDAQADILVWPEAAMPSVLDQEYWDIYEQVTQALLKQEISADSVYLFKVAKGLSAQEVQKENDSKFLNPKAKKTENIEANNMESRLLTNGRLIVGLDYDFILKLGKSLIAGVITADLNKNKFYNSVAHIDNDYQLQYLYDKQVLIPFGEYVPFRQYMFSFLQALAAKHGDYSAGKFIMPDQISFQFTTENNQKQTEKYKVAYLVCYESIFHHVLPKKSKLDCIIHISNDAWFGLSACLDMHFDHMKVHAIANRCCVIRCVNTGITAVIDKYGRVLSSLKKGELGVLITYIVY